jgi:Protein of unknown function (DUF3500)
VINYFVLDHQVVLSPCFWGSEPTSMQIDAETVTVCQEEVAASLAFIQSLTAAQQKVAIYRPRSPTRTCWRAPSPTTPSSPTAASPPPHSTGVCSRRSSRLWSRPSWNVESDVPRSA